MLLGLSVAPASRRENKNRRRRRNTEVFQGNKAKNCKVCAAGAVDTPGETPGLRQKTQMTPDEPLISEAFLSRLSRLRLSARTPRSGRAAGAYHSRTKGVSMDLAGYRPYELGDDIRWLDWSVYARLEKLYMKTFFDEQDSGVWLMLDASASMGATSAAKWLLARQMAAGLGAVALSGQNPLTLVILNEGVAERFYLGRGMKHLPRLLDKLGNLKPQGVTRLGAAAKKPLLRLNPSLALLISDGFDPAGLSDILQAMSVKGHEGTFIHVLDATDVTPQMEGDVRVVDAETGETVDINMDHRARTEFATAMGRRLDMQRAEALARGVAYLRAEAPAEPSPLLLRLLGGGVPLRGGRSAVTS